jgi:hypothetical protein
MECDLGVRILYLVFTNSIDASQIKKIPHELIKTSPVFYYLSLDIDVYNLLEKISKRNSCP